MHTASVPFPAVILAGGRSQRMGQNKATVLLAGERLIDLIASRLSRQGLSVALNAPQGLHSSLPLIPDTLPGYRGPLAGILSAMRFAASLPEPATHVLTVPIDSPFIPLNLAAALQAALASRESISIATSLGAAHPVVGVWPTSLAIDLETFLGTPENARVKSFLARHDTHYVDFPVIETPLGPLDPFFNLNTPDDLEVARRYVEFMA